MDVVARQYLRLSSLICKPMEKYKTAMDKLMFELREARMDNNSKQVEELLRKANSLVGEMRVALTQKLTI